LKIPVPVLLAIVALVGAVTGVGAGGAADRLTAHELLRQVGGFSRADLSAVDRGQPVARILHTDRREIAVVGAVRIRAARERLLERYRTVNYMKPGDIVLAAGVFSEPPKASDLQPLSIEDYDLDLRDCRPGDCRVRLSAEQIALFHRDVRWQSADWRAQSADVWRRVLADYAAAYAADGAAALTHYDNKKEPLSVRQEFQTLLDSCAFVAAWSPEFHAYLQEPFKTRLEGVENLLYWTKEDFGIRPVMRMSHQMLYSSAPEGQSRRAILIATKQLYAAHYLDAALGITLALEADRSAAVQDADAHATEGSGQEFYFIQVSRARTRSLSGFFRTMVRSTVLNRSRDLMDKTLRVTKQALER
jgi:hypothetical protein